MENVRHCKSEMSEIDLPLAEKGFQDLCQYASLAPIDEQKMYGHSQYCKTKPAIVQHDKIYMIRQRSSVPV